MTQPLGAVMAERDDLQPKARSFDRSAKSRAPVPSHKHDRLCIEVTEVPGQRNCWCRCAKCWQSHGFTRVIKKGTSTAGGEPKGRCVCPYCPCVEQTAEFIRACSMPVRA